MAVDTSLLPNDEGTEATVPGFRETAAEKSTAADG